MAEPLPLSVYRPPWVMAYGNQHWGLICHSVEVDYGQDHPEMVPVVEYLRRYPALDFLRTITLNDARFSGGRVEVDAVGSPWHAQGLRDGTIVADDLVWQITADLGIPLGRE